MSRQEYSLVLPAFTIGANAYDKVGQMTRHFGHKAVIIGGKTALSKAKPSLLKACEANGITVTDVLWYGGDATFEHADALIAQDAVKEADFVFAVGGGRAIDTCKVVADKSDKPLFAFPTVASNCAPTTSLGVIYKPDKSLAGYYFTPQPPVHTFINTAIIADSPYQLFWAGIGDAMSKECEALYSSRKADVFHTIYLGQALAKVCQGPLLKYGEQALKDFKSQTLSPALQECILDIIVSTGLVSNCMTAPDESYYYNSTVAHLFYNSATAVNHVAEKHLHGEIVSFGVLVLMTFAGMLEERAQLAEFYKKVGFPTTLADIDATEADIDTIVDRAPSIMEYKRMGDDITPELFRKAIVETDAFGKSLK